jgi:diguanylate cyclase (GGDEF)-like protein
MIWIWNSFAQGFSFVCIAYMFSRIKDMSVKETDLARTDSLTGLLNKRAFHERGAFLIDFSKRMQLPLTIAYMDIDNFKSVNDIFGHKRGDEILVMTSKIIQESLRKTDVICRLGGDEFSMIMPNTTVNDAQKTLEKLRATIENRMKLEGVAVTASVGALSCATPLEDLDQLIAAADKLMYTVKKSGKNKIHIINHAPENANTIRVLQA